MEPTTPDPTSANFSPTPFSPPPPPPTPTRSVGKKIFLILIIVIILALIGGGVFAYTVVFEAPRAALTESFATITTAQSFHQDVAIKVVTDSPTAFTAEGTIATDIEQLASGERRMATIITGKSAGFFVSAEVRFLDQTLYGKVIEFPLLSLLDLSTSTSTNPLGKWFSVSLGDIESFMTEQGADPADIAKVKEQINKISQTEGAPQFSELIEKGVLVFGGRATVAKVGVDWTRQYTVTIDKDKLASWLAEIDPRTPTESLKSITFDPIIITIGLFDPSLKKIAGGIKGMVGSGTVSFTVTYRDINGSITVAKPNNAIPLVQYIKQSMGEAESKRKEAGIKADFSDLHIVARNYYDQKKSYTNLCTQEPSFASVMKNIEAVTNQKPICRAKSTAFLMAGNTSSTTVWCVDSTGFSGGVDKIPTGFVCK
jgi:hypothetical protein